MTIADPSLTPAVAGTKIKATDYNGNFSSMVQYIKDNIVAMNETISTWSSIIGSIGTLGNLLTTAKDSLVNAINELKNSQLKFGTCTTASATSEKAVTASGFTYKDGAQLYILFTNANTASVPTINANSFGAKSIYTKSGHAIDGTNYKAYFPASCNIKFTYSTTLGGFYFDNVIVDEYTSTTTWYEIYADGKIKQGGYFASTTNATITLSKEFKDTNYSIFFGLETQSNSLNARWKNKTTTSFGVEYADNLYVGNYNVKGHWEAKGY